MSAWTPPPASFPYISAGVAPSITCFLRYVIDPSKIPEFETFGRVWIPLVERFGGRYHGYFLPSESASNVALAIFSFRIVERLR
jgi:hypothetical protein